MIPAEHPASHRWNFKHIGLLAIAALICGMALIAAGFFSRIVLPAGAPVDSALVFSVVRHALLGCLLACLQWAAGAGLALWFVTDRQAPPAKLLLIGFPLSLPLVAALSYVALAFPFGKLIALTGLISCFISYLKWRPRRGELRQVMQAALGIALPAFTLGCALGLVGHGPTSTLPGRPLGDVAFYASSMFTLQIQQFPILNLANEGENLHVFNLLFTLFGAALLQFMAIDPFLFVLATGACMYLFGLGLALHAFISLRSGPTSGFALVVLALAALVAARNPYWIVESTPVIFILPLAICVWNGIADDRPTRDALANFLAAVVGSALSKVTAAATLAPLACLPLIRRFGEFPTRQRVGMLLILSAAAFYAMFMILKYGASNLTVVGIGPESYTLWFNQHSNAGFFLYYILRDFGTALMAWLAFRLLPWPIAMALAGGLTTALLFPFFMHVNFVCVAMLLGLAGIEQPASLWKSRRLALAAFLLCLPATLYTGADNGTLGTVWIACIGAMMWAAASSARTFSAVDVPLTVRMDFRCIALAFVAVLLALVAFSRQQIVFSPTSASSHLEITPEMLDVWTAVRRRTPTRALVFTDQTGLDLSASAAWNTFATTSQRQIYLAGWFQTAELRFSPTLLEKRLEQNQSVLAGITAPTQLSYRGGPYESYFAVVDRKRTMSSNWFMTYANAKYALYRHRH